MQTLELEVMQITFVDKAVIKGEPRLTEDGYLVALAKVARTGVQDYLGSELGMPERQVVKVWRPEEEVFAVDSLRTYAHRPMTDNHPREQVNSKNWRDVAVGQTGGEIVRDGEFVQVPVVLMDAAAIDNWKKGKRELSMGYSADLELVDGVTPDGKEYNAIQRNLRMNHCALVDRARGGDRLRIGDESTRRINMPEATIRTVLVDGLQVETTEAGAAAIAKLQQTVNDRDTTINANAKAHEQALAVKDAAIAKAEADLAALKSKVLDDAAIDKLVGERAALIGKAKQVHDADYSGKSANEIRRLAVAGKFGDGAVAGKTDDYVAARFDLALEDSATPSPIGEAVRSTVGPGTRVNDASNGHNDYVRGLSSAWQNVGAK